jgi:hypothetical protein
MKQKIALILISFITLAALAVPAFAQQAEPITAVADRTQISSDETILLSIVVQGSTQPVMPTFTGFNVVGSSQSTQISIANGDMTTQAVYQLRLQPTQTGGLTIEPVSVTLNSQTYTTQPIAIEVTQGSAQPAASAGEPAPAPTTLNGQDLYVEASVDNARPYQGQQLTYTFRFYQAINLSGQPSYQPPAFTGLWNDVEPTQRQYSVEAAGRPYHVTEVDNVLFPTVAGELVIEPTTLVIPGGLWSNDTTLQTQPVVLDVQPLPAGAPLSFKGAVGKFALATNLDKPESKVGEPVTLRVEISGEGNLSTMGEPNWADSQDPNWRALPSDSSTYTELVNGRLRGSVSYERMLVPTTGGPLTVPAVEYTYFDPQTATYETLSSDPVVVNVTGSSTAYSAELPTDASQPQTTNLRPMMTVTAVADAAAPLVNQPWYWLLWLLPLGLVGGQIGWQKRQAHLARTADSRRSSQAAQHAYKALKQAEKEGQTATADAILFTYLEERLNQSVRGLTSNGRIALLQQQNISERTIANVEICLAQAEAARFAPAANTTSDLLAQTKTVIERLEKYLA